MWKTFAAAAVVAAAMLGSACGAEEKRIMSGSNAAATDFTHVVGPNGAAVYADGPQQGRPADARLPAGVRIQILQEAGRFSQIKSESGVRGYVETSDLVPIKK